MGQIKSYAVALFAAALAVTPCVALAQHASPAGIGVSTISIGETIDCQCEGCRAYRARLEGVFYATDLDGEITTEDIVPVQAVVPSQPVDIGSAPGSQISVGSSEAMTSLAARGAEFARQTMFVQTGQVSDVTSETTLTALSRPGASVIPAQTASLIAAPEAGAILRDAGPSNAVTVQRRSPVAFDPHVRGFRYGQVLSRVGGVWSPVRQDLDSPISKLDPSLIEDIAVIPGPYAAQYGPAFAFIDLETASTPRYQNGSETHARVGETFHDNRGRQHGRATVFGGGSDWGFIGHYGSRTGSDYDSGNNTRIPSSYDNQSFLGQMGFDLTSHSSMEVRYDRLDQNDTEYALQFFDINYLGNDSCNLRYVDVDPAGPFTQVRFDGWYNRTRYNGNNLNPSKAPVTLRVQSSIAAAIPGATPEDVGFFADTFGDRMISGGRVMGTLGDVDDVHTRIGADYRFEDHRIRENYLVVDELNQQDVRFFTNLPKSWLSDVGVFDELVLPLSSYWTATLGARADVVHTDVRNSEVRDGGNLQGSDLSQNDALYSFYFINDVLLTDNWSSRFGFGHGQRPPSLIERYSDGVFLGIIQSGFSRVIGDPNLKKERLWQVDWGLSCDYDDFRARGTLFHSWVVDFATYSGNLIMPPEGARLLNSVNTDLATLAGFELYGEGDWNEYLTFFSGMNYTQGTDQTIDAPLWGVAPLGGMAGVRLHDGDQGQTWGVEAALRMAANQSRIGYIRNTGTPGVIIPIEEPTGGFSIVDLRSYYNVSRRTSLIMGVENLLDKNYLTHLDLRLPAQGALSPTVPGLPAQAVLSPGTTFYTGIEFVN